MCDKCKAAKQEYDKHVDAAQDAFNKHKNEAFAKMNQAIRTCKLRYEL